MSDYTADDLKASFLRRNGNSRLSEFIAPMHPMYGNYIEINGRRIYEKFYPKEYAEATTLLHNYLNKFDEEKLKDHKQ